jgi:hypothetical protein
VRKTPTHIALLLAICMSVAPLAVAGDVSGFVAMGPDPGGKSGETVTPETTKTDHPATSGPSDSTPSSTKRSENSGNQKDGSAAKGDRAPGQGNTNSAGDTSARQR